MSAFGMTPAAGTVTFTVDGNYTVSTDKQNYAKSVAVDYSGSTLITQIYIKVTVTGSGKISGTLTATNGTTTSTLALSTEVV